MKISDIYSEYMIPKNLGEHMLRVAGVLKVTADNWTGEKLHNEALIIAGCLHDLAKPMTFDLAK